MALEFCDGETSTEQNPLHIYQEAGNYTVSLDIEREGYSDSFTYENYIKVTDILIEDFESGFPGSWLISDANSDNNTWNLFSETSSGGADIAYSGDFSMGITYVFNDSNDDWLITDEYQLPNNGTYHLNLWPDLFLPII